MDSRSLGIIVGMQAEARFVGTAAHHMGFRIAVGGGTATGAEEAARRLVAEGALGLVSIGLSGGLQPSLPAGRVLIPTAIVLETGQRIPTDPELNQLLGGPTPHTILGRDQVAVDVLTKKILWTRTGGAAVDMESGSVARVAVEFGLPCAAIRVICDPANRQLPPAAVTALDSGGKIRLWTILQAVATQPSQVPSLIGLATDAFAARRAIIRHLWSLKPDHSAGKPDQPASRAA